LRGPDPLVPISIRRGTPSDSELLAEIGAETFSDTFGPYNTPEDMRMYLAIAFAPGIQAAELADPLSVFLVAEVRHECVGYARLREGRPSLPLHANRPIEIIRFYARSRWIGRKVGASLMEACLHESLRRDCDQIWLDVWEENERAIAFYARWGFVEVGRQAFVLGADVQNDLIMARSVTG